MEDLKIDPEAIVVSENVIGHGSSGRLLTGKWKEKDVTVKTAIKFKKDDPEVCTHSSAHAYQVCRG